MSKIVIVGGGVIGLFSAYYLTEKGYKVTVLDQRDFSDNCSYGNAGMIVPSHVIPLAAPGMIAKGVKWMFNSKSPFYVRPRLSSELMGWGMKFYRSANQKHVDQSKVALRDISLMSKALYKELHNEVNSFNYEDKGLLMLFQSEKMAEEETEAGEIAKALGLEVDMLNQSEVKQLESKVELNAIGGVHYKSDAHLHPGQLMRFLLDNLRARGVEFRAGTEVLGVELSGSRIKALRTNNGNVDGDEFVVAAGAWSGRLSKLFGEPLHLLPGKGYSFTQERVERGPSIPSILCEGKVAVTPMANDLRFGGTMEITHVKDDAINMNRVEGIVNTINSFYPELSIQLPEQKNVWKGFRPCSPTGLPYISRSKQKPNVIYATGHGMMGLSLGPATGKLVQEIVSGESTTISTHKFGVE